MSDLSIALITGGFTLGAVALTFAGNAVTDQLRISGPQWFADPAGAGITPVPINETPGVAMDGPAHYRKAEELAEKAAEYLGQGDGQAAAGVWAAVAQVHATLAVAGTFERTQAGSTHPEAATPQRRREAARTSHGASGHREHRTCSFFRRPPK